jgi:hypothetical protein
VTIPAYPLLWPAGWKRTPSHLRTTARFVKKERKTYAGGNSYMQVRELSITDGVDRVRTELTRMGIMDDDLVINSNLQLRLDGFPKSGQHEPYDPGIVVYWMDAGETRCMAIDRYDRVADNLAAVAATLEAMRAIERHGGAEILHRAFTGFTALPSSAESWWGILGVEPNARAVEIDAAYRRRRSEAHPDRGGSADAFDAVQRAYEQATRVSQ